MNHGEGRCILNEDHKMNRNERLRRVVLLCAHCVRNLAYHRASHTKLVNRSTDFWRTIDGNFLDIAVLEWCKLFGDEKAKHSWQSVVTDRARFYSELLKHMDMTATEFDDYSGEVRKYRDKFIAHLDDARVMDIPFMDRARHSVEFYHRYVVETEVTEGGLNKLPNDLVAYYNQCHREADRAI
jgi:hypothetical protein